MKSPPLAFNRQMNRVVFGLSTAFILLFLPISISAIPLLGPTDELETRMESIEKKQSEIEKEIQVATKVYDAKWEILIFTLILLLGGGGAVFYGMYKLLGGILQGEAESLRKNLASTLDSEMSKKLTAEMTWSQVRMLSSHAYIYAEIAEGYDPQSSAWRRHLESAIWQGREALEKLQELPETYHQWRKRKCHITNNLAYCLMLIGDSKQREEALKHATYAKESASGFPDGYRWEDTYGWVLLTFARDDQERREGVEYLEKLYTRPELPQGWVSMRKQKLHKFLNPSG